MPKSACGWLSAKYEAAGNAARMTMFCLCAKAAVEVSGLCSLDLRRLS